MKIILQRSIALLMAVLLAAGLLGPAQVQAAPQVIPVCGWTGAVGTNWSNPGNWASIPTQPACPGLSNGMTVSLAFPAAATRKINTNNLTNLQVARLAIEGGGVGDYEIGGNQFSLSTDVITTGGNQTLSLPIQLAGDIEANVSGTLHLDGAISGAYGITKVGSGTLDLDASSSFSGGATVSAGKVILSQSQAGGSGALVVENNATLTVASAVSSLANPLTLTGTGAGGLGALHYEGAALSLFGPVTLAAAATLQSTTGTLTLYNAIGGTGDLTLDGPAFILSGSYANTFAGGLSLPHGVLTLDHPDGVTAVPGNLSVGPGDASKNAQVIAMADNQFSSTSQMSLGMYTVLNLQGHSQTIRGITAWDRPCQVNIGSATLTIDTSYSSLNYSSCDVLGTGTVLVKGSGSQNFFDNDPANPFNGSLDVQGTAGTAASYLDAFHTTGPYYLHSNSAGGLRAGSTVGSVLVENAWVYFDMPALADRSQVGSLLMSGASTHANFNFNAANAWGPRVTGTVSLGSVPLWPCYYTGFAPDLANTPENPNWRMLIQNDSGAPVTGTFAGLPEGAQTTLMACFSGTSYPLRITYQGGDGNDVVVTRLAEDTLTLQVFPTPERSNQAISLQAILSAADNPAGAAPSKKAAFYDGSQLIGEASFSGFTAVLPGVTFARGSHAVQARLVGDPNFADASSNTANFSVRGVLFVPLLRK